jgi:glycosyltransferase involved in cell wall biosynthesis
MIHAISPQAALLAILATAGMAVKIAWHVHAATQGSLLDTALGNCFLLSGRALAMCSSVETAQRLPGLLLRPTGARRRVHALLQAVDPAEFHPATPTDRSVDARSLRNSLGIPSQPFVMGIAGQLTKARGQLELIEALPGIISQVPNAVLVVAGTPRSKSDWEYRARMEEAIGRLALDRRVYLTGERESMPKLFRGMDVVIVNSPRGPFGRVALEAMACGRPVIATNVGGAAEYIRHGYDGFLYEAGNYSSLAGHLADLAENPRLRCEVGALAREKVTCLFTPDIQAARLLGIYSRNIAKDSVLSDFLLPSAPCVPAEKDRRA